MEREVTEKVGMTITEKILARNSGSSSVEPGQFINVHPDLVFANDATLSSVIKIFETTGAEKVFDPDKVAFIFDHGVPSKDIATAETCKLTREFSQKMGVEKLFDIGRNGIEHTLLPEKGLILPGQVIIGQDSHTCTHGAWATFATAMGATDVAVALALGESWIRVPESIKFNYEGEIPRWVSGKDLILFTIREIGVNGALYKAMEFTGPVIEKLSMSDRMTVCNMAIEAGAKNGVIKADNTLKEHLRISNDPSFVHLESDDDAHYVQEHNFNVSNLSPQVACPSSPGNVANVEDLNGVSVNQVVIGSCTNGKLEDLRNAAKVLKGRKIHNDVRLLVFPATQAIYLQALREGLLEIFVKAEGIINPPTCGCCYGGHLGILAEGEVAISTTNRNFVGRMGHPKSKVYLSNPAVAAASAVMGRIARPEEVVNE